MRDAWTTVDCHAPTHKPEETTTSEEESGGCHISKSIWTAGISKKLACRTEGTADPNFDNFERLFVGILYYSKLFLLYSGHLIRGRPNYLVYTGTCSYQHMQAYSQLTINLLFSSFFRRSRQSTKIVKFCAHRKFPSIQ